MIESGETVPVSVHILDKEYRIACEKGEEEALFASAHYLDERMREIKRKGKVIGGERIAVLVALHLASDLLKHKGSLYEDGRKPEVSDEGEKRVEVTASRLRAMQKKIEGAIKEAQPYI